jgi:YVTN family beta-propeller protein
VPNGRFGFTPERDQDTVAKIDLERRTVVQRVAFPPGSKPFMLRVRPDGRVLWVQTQATAMNVVLDAESMEVLQSVPVGKDPEQSAFQPGGGPYGLIAHLASDALFVLDSGSGDVVTQIEFGQSQGNICFSPDGALAFVTSGSGNEVVVVDMASLTIVGHIPTGMHPQGLVLLNPSLP